MNRIQPLLQRGHWPFKSAGEGRPMGRVEDFQVMGVRGEWSPPSVITGEFWLPSLYRCWDTGPVFKGVLEQFLISSVNSFGSLEISSASTSSEPGVILRTQPGAFRDSDPSVCLSGPRLGPSQEKGSEESEQSLGRERMFVTEYYHQC